MLLIILNRCEQEPGATVGCVGYDGRIVQSKESTTAVLPDLPAASSGVHEDLV